MLEFETLSVMNYNYYVKSVLVIF